MTQSMRRGFMLACVLSFAGLEVGCGDREKVIYPTSTEPVLVEPTLGVSGGAPRAAPVKPESPDKAAPAPGQPSNAGKDSPKRND